MKYTDLKELLPSATYIYVDVTDEEIDLVTSGTIYTTTFEEVKILGTSTMIGALKAKLIEEPANVSVQGSTDFGTVEVAPIEVPADNVV